MLTCALAQEVRERSGREALLLRHYGELMPRLRAEQLDPRREPQATLFGARLDLARMPRLAGALERLYALLAAAGVPAERALPGRSPAELVARHPTIAALYPATYYGGFMPLLYGYPADLASFARALRDAPPEAVIDRYLAAPLIHELAHLAPSRRAELPIYLDECIAGHLGVLALPELAYPAPGEDNGLFAAPWIAQVGRALARVAGLDPLLRAHAGVAPWREVLPPPLLEGVGRLGWGEYLAARAPHFLSDNVHPGRWLELIYADPPPEHADDEAHLAEALRAMCLDNHQVELSFRVRTRPPPSPVRVDLVTGWMTTAGGPHDPAGLGFHLPPAWARRVQTQGIAEFFIDLRDPRGIPELATVLRSGGCSSGAMVETPAYRLRAVTT